MKGTVMQSADVPELLLQGHSSQCFGHKQASVVLWLQTPSSKVLDLVRF